MAPGIRTGKEYIESLRDGREVWISGERVEDVPTHPAFAGVVETIAGAYDAQHDPEHRQLVTWTSPTSGELVPLTFKLPDSREDLAARRRMADLYSRRTGGTMARLPEYGGAFAIGLLNLAQELGPERKARAKSWFEQCRERDVCIATSFVDPQVDRSKPARETGLLRLVEERADGIVISGCKSVATLGPAANELMVMTIVRSSQSADEVIYVALSPGTPGLRFFCREPFAPGRTLRDAPLSSRFDEPDALALFDRVFIPNERVFVAGDVNMTRAPGFFPKVLVWPWFHNLIRVAVKAELIAGVATMLAEYLNTWHLPQVQEAIAEIVEYGHVLQALVHAGEAECVRMPSGLVAPGPVFMNVAKVYAVRGYPRLLEIVRELAGQGIIMAPRSVDLEQTELGSIVRSYYGAYGVDADDRIRLFRLAWDLTCDSFAGRQTLFELFNAGGVTATKLGLATQTDKSRHLELARRLAGISPSG